MVHQFADAPIDCLHQKLQQICRDEAVSERREAETGKKKRGVKDSGYRPKILMSLCEKSAICESRAARDTLVFSTNKEKLKDGGKSPWRRDFDPITMKKAAESINVHKAAYIPM